MKIPKRQPVGEDYKNSVDHSEREQSGKFYAVACDDQFSDAREQVRQRQSVNEREKRGDMFKCCHATREWKLLIFTISARRLFGQEIRIADRRGVNRAVDLP